MPLKLKKASAAAPKKPAKAAPPKGVITRSTIVTAAPKGLKESTTLKVFDIPLAMLVEHSENPNVQNEKIHDETVEKIRRDGFDEPIIVVPNVIKGKPDGKYLIVSGHHRKKAMAALGKAAVPAVIREGWSEDQAAIELINRNTLRGSIDPYKFTELFERLQKRYDPEQLKKMIGLTEKKAFQQLFKKVADTLPPRQKQKLEEAKESIKSVDDLTGILHKIFEEHGDELDWGFMVFSHGGQKHHYVKISKDTEKSLADIEAKLKKADVQADVFFKALLADKTVIGNVIEQVTGNAS